MDNPDRLDCGTYQGDAMDDRDITGLGFQPEYLIIKSEENHRGAHRPASVGEGDVTLQFHGSNSILNGIQALLPDGFQVGTDNQVNQNGNNFHWTAFAGADTAVTADLQLVKTVGNPIPDEGDEITYTITVANAGPDSASGIVIYDQLPPGVTYVSDLPSQGEYLPGPGGWNLGDLAAGDSATLDIVASVDGGTAGTTIINTASVSMMDQYDPGPGDNTDSAPISVRGVDLQVTKIVDNPTPNEWSTLTYLVTLANNGPNDGTGIVVTDQLPGGVTYVEDLVSQGSYDSVTGAWQVGDLAAGESATLSLTATVDAGTGGLLITNLAAIEAAGQTDPDAGNNSDTADIRVQSVDLQVTKYYGPIEPQVGEQVSFGIMAVNQGPNTATGIEITDLLPSDVTFVSATPTQGTYDSETGLWDVGSIAFSRSASLAIATLVDSSAAGAEVINTVTITAADQADPVGDNNSSTVSFRIPSSDMELAKDANLPAPSEGDTVVYRLVLHNLGPDDGAGLAVADTLPVGVSYLGAVPSQGTYIPGTAIWTVGAVAVGDSATLEIGATVDQGTAGLHIVNAAVISAADHFDPVPGNNGGEAVIDVAGAHGADLQLIKSVDRPAPSEGDTVTFRVVLRDLGPTDGTGIVVADTLPSGLSFLAAAASQGGYDADTGLWTMIAVAAGDSASLMLAATVDPGTDGDTIVNTAAITSADQIDPDAENNSDNAACNVAVPASADLEVTKVADRELVNAGDEVTFTVMVRNAGPAAGTGIALADTLPDGLTFVSSTPSQGDYDDQTGLWTVSGIAAGDSARLDLTAMVNEGMWGSTITNLAAVAAADQNDPDGGNNTDSASITVGGIQPLGRIFVRVIGDEDRSLQPGGQPLTALSLELINESTQHDVLRSFTLTNAATGEGTQAQLDADWASLQLLATIMVDQGQPGGTDTFEPHTATFEDGSLIFDGLDLALAPQETLQLHVRGSASMTARDGDVLAVSVAQAADLDFTQQVQQAENWPLEGERNLLVDGFTADQLDLVPIESVIFPVGSTRNLAYNVGLPPNGYEDDHLIKLNVLNAGTAMPADDIAKIEAWADNGDETFEIASDVLLGSFVYTGNRWELTGLWHPVPLEGLRLYITMDIAPTGTAGRTIRLGLPSGDDVGVGMASGNDGPIEDPVFNPSSQSISQSDHIILTATPLASGPIVPGRDAALLLQLVATNTYPDAMMLTDLNVTNATEGRGGTPQEDLDGTVDLLRLWWDEDGDGELTGADLDLGSAGFSGGTADFVGLGVTLDSGAANHLFLTADISLLDAADGDVIAAVITEGLDLTFDPPAAVAATWPLDSGAQWTVDGMIAAQVGVKPVPAVALSAGDGPVLALDVIVSANGYRDDVLNGMKVVNEGTATASDFSSLVLWQDGGDGSFSAGGGDDVELGPLVWLDDGWVSTVLATPISTTGRLRLFTALTVSETPTDSATVQLAIPLDGITVASDNDGPRDEMVVNPNALLLSTAPLLATIELEDPASTLGQTVGVSMVVRNVGAEDALDVTPSALTPGGDGALALVSGPEPATFDLATGETDTFTWFYSATATGDVQFAGSCEGTGAIGGLPRLSLTTSSPNHHVYAPVGDLGLFGVGNMPFSISRGQTDVVPLTLTLVNSGGAEAADARLDRLRIRLEDDGGGGIVPAELLSRVVVSEGANVYLEKTALETSGSEVDLLLTSPAIITGSEPISVGIRLDISPTTTTPSFRVAILDSTWFEAYDDISAAAVPVILQEGQFPLVSGLGRIVAEATELRVAQVPGTLQHVGQGQQDVPLLTLQLENPGPEEFSSDIAIGSFTVGLRDTNGVPLTTPQSFLEKIRVEGPFQVHTDRYLIAEDDTSLTLYLSPPLTVPVNTQVEVAIRGDIAPAAALGAFRVDVGDTNAFDARDANTGVEVSVDFVPDAITGAAIAVEAPATTVRAAGEPELPAALTIGARGIPVMTLTLRHAGFAGEAAVRVDSLSILCRDEARLPLAPDTFVDRLRVMRGEDVIGSLSDPGGDVGSLTVALNGLSLLSGQSTDLSLVFDVEAAAPATGVELLVDDAGIHIHDANLNDPVVVQPEIGSSFPFTSGLSYLQAPADELVIGFQGQMPAVLAALASEVSVARLSLHNPAEEVGSIAVEDLTVRASDLVLEPLLIGAAVVSVAAYRDGEAWAASSSLAAEDSTALLVPLGDPLQVEAGQLVELELRLVFRGDTTVENLRIGVDRDDIGVVQPDGAVLAIRVEPVQGTVFPFWSEPGNFTALGLSESYSNFPNPFAAGRQSTRFAYALTRDATVSLRVLTARGEMVATILDGSPRLAGLHQDDEWNGLNGRGVAVRNGVYVAELVVRFSDGSEQRVLRKVAVVR